MKNKINLVLVAAVAILAVVAAVFGWRYAELAATAKQGGAGQSCSVGANQANGLKMNIVTVAQTDDFYNIKVEYPQFDAADAAFNAKIASTVNGMIDAFKKEAKDNFDARNATMPAGQAVLQNPEEPFDFIAAWTPAQFGPRYISFMMNVYYFSGGAHGTDRIFAFNYDLQNKKEITVGDFLGFADGLDKLAKLAQVQVAAQLQSGGMEANDSLTQMIQDGTKAIADNYRNFTFGYGKLTIYFEQYQAAPGSAGSVTINIYNDNLKRAGIDTDFLN